MPGVKTFPTPNEINNAEDSLEEELSRRAVQQLSEVRSADNVHVRDILPADDLESGGDNGWNGTDRVWSQGGLAADTESHTYTIDPDAKAEKKLVGIFAISAIEADPETTEVVFKDATGSTFERVQVDEVLERGQDDDNIALLEHPLLVNVDETVEIHQWVADPGTGPYDDDLVLHGAVAEKRGKTLGERP